MTRWYFDQYAAGEWLRTQTGSSSARLWKWAGNGPEHIVIRKPVHGAPELLCGHTPARAAWTPFARTVCAWLSGNPCAKCRTALRRAMAGKP